MSDTARAEAVLTHVVTAIVDHPDDVKVSTDADREPVVAAAQGVRHFQYERREAAFVAADFLAVQRQSSVRLNLT